MRDIQTEIGTRTGDSIPMCQNVISGSKGTNGSGGLQGPFSGVQDGLNRARAAGHAVDTMDELLTVDELAEWLKVRPSWIYERTPAPR